jgi:hypothetical protein
MLSFTSYLLAIKPEPHQLHYITNYEEICNRNVTSNNTNYYGKSWFTILSALVECTVHSFQLGVLSKTNHLRQITMNKNQLWTYIYIYIFLMKPCRDANALKTQAKLPLRKNCLIKKTGNMCITEYILVNYVSWFVHTIYFYWEYKN